MVELGDHCHTFVIPRLQKVIAGEDKGDVTGVVGWQGGGGYRYFKLAPSLLETDRWGREVISKAYNAEMLAEALCKIEGFTYAPSDAVYWQQGHSTEHDFIYVTTQSFGVERLQQLSEEVGTERSLLLLCSAFRGHTDRWPNLTVKKIPSHIRSRCEWGHDDYSLNVGNLPQAPARTEPREPSTAKNIAGQPDLFGLGLGGIDEQRLDDYVVSGLVDFDDVAYDEHADLLYDLSEQVVTHLQGYLSLEGTRKVLRLQKKDIARFVHAQMQKHFWQDLAVEYEVVVTRGFTALRPSAYTALVGEQPIDFKTSPSDKSNMSKYLFGGFARCFYALQKFQSDAERKLAVILERESLKWFKPAKGQFQIFYKWGSDHPEYQPDFVAETDDRIFMLEPKAANQMTDEEVLAKREAAERWCIQASDHARGYGGKPWTYVLIPHDAIAENMTLDGLATLYAAHAGP